MIRCLLKITRLITTRQFWVLIPRLSGLQTSLHSFTAFPTVLFVVLTDQTASVTFRCIFIGRQTLREPYSISPYLLISWLSEDLQVSWMAVWIWDAPHYGMSEPWLQSASWWPAFMDDDECFSGVDWWEASAIFTKLPSWWCQRWCRNWRTLSVCQGYIRKRLAFNHWYGLFWVSFTRINFPNQKLEP